MQILVIGKFYIEGFARHIAETLEAMGHKVIRFEIGFKSGSISGHFGQRVDKVLGVLYLSSDSIPAIREHRMKALWQVAEQDSIDIVIVGHDFLWPTEITELKRRTHAKVAMWCPDSLANFGRAFFMNATYDGLFFKDPYIVHAMGDVLNSPVYYLPECFNPVLHSLPEEDIGNQAAYKCDITTAGHPHTWRVEFFSHLINYDVKMWGTQKPLWMPKGIVTELYQKREVFNHDKVRAFRGAKMVINNLFYGEIWGVNARCFEVAGAGAFQIVDWRPCLSQLFEDGKELISFTSIADLKQKIDYWLPRDAERRVIAKAGMRRAYSEHTYQHRLSLLLATLSGSAKGFPMPEVIPN